MCALAIPTGGTAQEGWAPKSRLSTAMAGAARPQGGRAMPSATEIWDLFLRCDFGLYFCCTSFNLASAPASVTEIFWEPAPGFRIIVTEAPRRRATACRPWILPDKDDSI